MKKIFLALMAVAAIALTGCKGKTVVSPDSALEYAKLCEKLMKLPQSSVNSEMDNAGWVKVNDSTYVPTKESKAAYDKVMKKYSVSNFVAVGAVLHIFFTNDVCMQAVIEYRYTDAGKNKSTIAAIAEYMLNGGVKKDLIIASIDGKEYEEKDLPTFIQDVKNQDWKQRVEDAMSTPSGGVTLSGFLFTIDGKVVYVSNYNCYIWEEFM